MTMTMTKNRQIGEYFEGGLASTNQIFPPSHPLGISGAVFEDDPDEIFLWGHSKGH